MYTRHWEGSSRQPRGLSLGRPRCLFSGTLIVAEWKLLFSACTIAAVAVATSVTSLLGTRLRQGHNVSQRVSTCHDGSRRVTTGHTRFLSVLRKKILSTPSAVPSLFCLNALSGFSALRSHLGHKCGDVLLGRRLKSLLTMNITPASTPNSTSFKRITRQLCVMRIGFFGSCVWVCAVSCP